jgi:hypothetical protein
MPSYVPLQHPPQPVPWYLEASSQTLSERNEDMEIFQEMKKQKPSPTNSRFSLSSWLEASDLVLFSSSRKDFYEQCEEISWMQEKTNNILVCRIELA